MTDTTKTKTQNKSQKKSPRWMKVLLVISVSLNLLVIGAISSRIYFGPPGFNIAGKHGSLANPNAMRYAGVHLMWKLSREKRREIYTLVRGHKASMEPQLRTLVKARANFADILKTDYKPQDLKAALAEINVIEGAVQNKSNELLAIFINHLSPQERKQYAEILLSPSRRHWFKQKN